MTLKQVLKRSKQNKPREREKTLTNIVDEPLKASVRSTGLRSRLTIKDVEDALD